MHTFHIRFEYTVAATDCADFIYPLLSVDLEKLVAKGIYKKSTLVKYKTTEKHLLEYIQWRNNGCDILLIDLNVEFAHSFQYYLQAEKGLSINSSWEDDKKSEKSHLRLFR